MSAETFKCADCKQEKPVQHDGGTGYGIDPKTGLKVCYACCGLRDARDMRETGRATLYLSKEQDTSDALGAPRPTGYAVTNWPGTFRRDVLRMTTGRHNIAGKRYDVWFRHAGESWHGVTYGDNTQICHCKRVAP